MEKTDNGILMTEGEINEFIQKALDEFEQSLVKSIDKECGSRNSISVENVKKLIHTHKEDVSDIFYVVDDEI